MVLDEQANVRPPEDLRVGVVQQALAHARWSGCGVRRRRPTPPHACTQTMQCS